jgi:hypothetical protein
MFEVQRLIWLIEQNGVLSGGDSSVGAREALRACLRADPADRRRLSRLKTLFWETALRDNFSLAIARSTVDLNERAVMLLALAERFERGEQIDAGVPAMYELGLIRMRQAQLEELHENVRAELRSAEAYFRAVIDADQQPWRRLAEERLTMLRQAAPGTEGP